MAGAKSDQLLRYRRARSSRTHHAEHEVANHHLYLGSECTNVAVEQVRRKMGRRNVVHPIVFPSAEASDAGTHCSNSDYGNGVSVGACNAAVKCELTVFS